MIDMTKQSQYLVLKDRRGDGYYVGYLEQDISGVWCAHHHYFLGECLEKLYQTFSEALDVLNETVCDACYKKLNLETNPHSKSNSKKCIDCCEN